MRGFLRAGRLIVGAWIALCLFAGAAARAAAPTPVFSPPAPSATPSGPLGDLVRLGQEVFDHTQTAAKPYVGDALTCQNCHLDSGRLANSAPMWAAYVAYPQYRSKTRHVDTIEDRIQDCFRYSMNGKPPPDDSKELRALVSYFYWMANGAPVGAKLPGAGYPRLAKPAKAPDPQRGAAVYADHCALCHGGQGQGRTAGGSYVFPPLWGAKSYNWGAGMEVVGTAAGFIKANMPLGLAGSLSDQDAWDVAAFVDSRPRPQDPRFTGNLEETRRKYHGSGDYYGLDVDGVLLGAANTSSR